MQYRSLAAELSAQLPGARPRALLFMAAEGGAGATTVVLNLGITLAQQEETRAVVADAHFARPAVAARFGLPAALGLRDVLVRHTPLAWCLHETLQPSLWALPAGQPDAPPAEAAGPALEQLRARADWVLIDAGPWDAGLAALAEACDAVYLVRRDGAAHERLTATVLDATGRLRGCVVTQRAA